MTVLTIISFSISLEFTKINLIGRDVRQQSLSNYGTYPRTLNYFNVKKQHIQMEMSITATTLYKSPSSKIHL